MWLEDPFKSVIADTLDSLAAASVRYRMAIGPDAGRRTLSL